MQQMLLSFGACAVVRGCYGGTRCPPYVDQLQVPLFFLLGAGPLHSAPLPQPQEIIVADYRSRFREGRVPV